MQYLEPARKDATRRGDIMDAQVKSVFISHSSHDKVFVNRLVTRLKENGVRDIWYDVLDLGPPPNCTTRLQPAYAHATSLLSCSLRRRREVHGSATKSRRP
jgi:hypothetical protein